VRGLACGHAFHAVCLDPWLTTRRACCPLCKADYYTPKPRPQVPEGSSGTTGVITVTLPGDSRGNRTNLPSRPRHAFFGFGRPEGRRASQPATSRRQRAGGLQPGQNVAFSFFGRPRATDTTEPTRPSPGSSAQASSGGLLSGLRTALPSLRAPWGRNNQAPTEPAPSDANPAVTPSQLEAGARNPPN
jgi:hypothetical protein